RPALPGLLAAAGRVELAPVMKGVRQILIDATVAGNGLSHVLAGVAVGIQHGFGGGAQPLARLLVFGEARRRRGVRNRGISSVAGPHGYGPVAAAKWGVHRARRDSSAGIAQTAEQRFEKSLLRGRGYILRAAIVLRQRPDDPLALHFVVGAMARAFQLRSGAIDVSTHLTDLVVERSTSR